MAQVLHLAGLRWHTPWCYQPCDKFRRCGPTSSCQRFRTFSRQLGRGIQRFSPLKDQLQSGNLPGDLRLWGQLLSLHQLLASCGGACAPVRKVLWNTGYLLWQPHVDCSPENEVSQHLNPTHFFSIIQSFLRLLWAHLKPWTEAPTRRWWTRAKLMSCVTMCWVQHWVCRHLPTVAG